MPGSTSMARPASLLLLALCLCVSSPAQADWAGPDAAEKELLKSIKSEKYIRGREQAEKILRKSPQSIIARYGLARVFHDEEANLPRSLYHARLAEGHLTRRFSERPTDAQARVWHRRILAEQVVILGEMDRRRQQLSVMDRHDALYRPLMDRWRIWPLMKLHRFKEAGDLARKVALSENQHERISGFNGMIAIESERMRPRKCFQAGMKAVTATSYQSCILNQNTAEAAFAIFKFDEVERLALKSVQAMLQDCPATAYPHLARLYLLRADFQRAMDAVKSSRQQKIERRYRQQFEMGNTAGLARLLYTLGHFTKAYNLAKRVLRAPDRVGMTSFSDDVMRVIYTLDYHATLMAHIESLREQSSVRPLGLDKAGLWLSIADLRRRAWSARRRMARLLSQTTDLTRLVRPYLKPLPPWHAGALIDAVGKGMLLRALDDARRRETMPKEAAPYYAALAGEVAFRDGRLKEALTLAGEALGALPKDEVLLRGRTQAWAADSARRLGKNKEARDLFHQVLQRFPTALRLLGIPLPVALRADSRALSGAVASRLRDSRRLVMGDLGFTVRVTGEKERVRICLSGQGGRRYACSETDLGQAAARDEQVALALDAFHRKVFAPKIDLTQRDINSLDGSAVRGDADEVLREVLER